MTKKIAQAALDNMPDKFKKDEFIERIEFLEILDERIKEADETEGIPHEKVMEMIKKW